MPRDIEEMSIFDDVQSGVPQLTNAELVQLRIRVIALENLVITLLVDASDRQLRLVRDMAAYISPRPGFTQHPLTVHAAAEIMHLLERARHFRGRDVFMSSCQAFQSGAASPMWPRRGLW